MMTGALPGASSRSVRSTLRAPAGMGVSAPYSSISVSAGFDAPELPAAAFAPRKFEHPLFRFGRLEVELGTQAAEGGVDPVVPVHLAAVGAQREGAGCIQQLFAPLMGAGKDDAAQPDRLGEAEGHAAGFALAPAPDRRIADHVARLHAG